jgi:hypothetical protein
LPDNTWNGYTDRADDFSSVAYWYQTEPHKPFPPLPRGADRLYFSNAAVLEGEAMLEQASSSGPKPVRQEMGGWSGDAQLFFTPPQSPAWVSVKFNVPKDGRYLVVAHCTRSFDYGNYQAHLDGKPVGPVMDLYSKEVAQPKGYKLGEHDLTAGEHEVKFETSSKNADSKGYYFGLDFIELEPLPAAK